MIILRFMQSQSYVYNRQLSMFIAFYCLINNVYRHFAVLSAISSQFNMKLRGSLLVIVCSLIVEFCNVTQKKYMLFSTDLNDRILLYVIQGLLFLLYPLVGHLTDVYLTRYRSLKLSFGILILAALLIILYIGIDTGATSIWKLNIFHERPTVAVWIVIFLLYIIGLELFQANAIQFGLDQLLEAPTSKLIAFIHWYYWAQNVGSLALFYFLNSGFVALNEIEKLTNNTINQALNGNLNYTVFVVFLITMIVIFITVFVAFCTRKKLFYIEKASLNPFKNIYKVLKYSWKHKIPEHRSAFTYWEEDIPRRIDLGKIKYGGPFTNEEVEDTKTFLRILPLLLCLFGYHLAGDGYSAPEQLQRTSCPSLPVLLLVVINPLHMSTLVAVVGIPLYRLVIVKVFPRLKNVRMLTKMWIGLYLSLLQVILYIIVVVNHDTTYWQQHHTDLNNQAYLYTRARECFIIRTGCDFNSILIIWNCQQYNDPVDNTYLWFSIPQLLIGLSSLLVSMTVFEFISAQAPRTTQGLLIGLWYATFSIRYLVVGILNNLIIERKSWLIYEGVKGFLILVSLVLFSCVSKHYCYRQRDEIVNVQGMIEDTHEKWLDQEEEYMQERRDFYQTMSSYRSVS